MIDPLNPNQETPEDNSDQMTPQDYKDWLARIRFAHSFHKKDIVPKYRIAKKRYNSEIGYIKTNRMATKHEDLNFLFKAVRNFISSIFFRNPDIDLTARNEENARNIENLEQALNDDVKDNSELKELIRSNLIDESLSGLGALYIDYEYLDEETDEPVGTRQMLDENGFPVEVPLTDDTGRVMMKRNILKNRVCVYKIRPENLIRPPYQQFYNHKSSPYLGYADIVSLDTLRNDQSLDQEIVSQLKGKEYRSLLDRDLYDQKEIGEGSQKDIQYVLIYVVFIRDESKKTMKRLVLTDEFTGDKPLAYGDWNKGHGKDGLGYPIHVLALNDPSDNFIPPSEAWILESILKVIDYTYAKMVKHIRKASTRTLVKTGSGGASKAELDKIAKNIDLELIGLADVPAGVPLGNIIHQVQDQMLSQDHVDMFLLCKSIFDQLSRQPQFSKPEVINRKKTATESQMIQGQDNSVGGDYIDKFREYLKELFIDWARLLQTNMQGVRQANIELEDGAKEPREFTREDIAGDFDCDINVESFMPPNREVKRMIAKETLSDLIGMKPIIDQSGYALNVKKAVDLYVENVDMRDSEDLLIPKPIRNIERQAMDFAAKGIPFNPEELGDFNEALKNGMAMFSDDAIMQGFPMLNDPNGQFIQLLQFLGRQTQQAQKTNSPSRQRSISDSGASPDIRSNSTLMGDAQRG